ncbi:hypothetical protein GP486_001845 [Trichoglossum hirsutum]|uniref:Copper amine oxidase catalytic domain-containing protein n=1 Tax=Trichoglossum hirsutum TaxID=265104 RepID=A0A9P8LG74_9PEZI|nr:hypothetical protein GP486_001845 [Trichoglossum hirsutum]
MKLFFEQPALAILLLLLWRAACEQIVFSDNRPAISIQVTGPSQADLNATVSRALNTCQVRELLGDSRYRLLYSELLSPSTELYPDTKDEGNMFQATVYDYTRGRVIFPKGILPDIFSSDVALANIQPLPSLEELAEAARIAGIGPSVTENARPYMPPYEARDFPDGTSHRLLHLAIGSANLSRLAYVNMNNGSVQAILAQGAVCQAPADSNQASVNINTPGTANFVISKNGNTLWAFEVTRPSSSAGTNGAGIELRNVKYKGKSVLYQASVPILNVEYEDKTPPVSCGPYYRDWQNSEYPLHCPPAKEFAPWLRLCKTPAATIVDPPFTDGGDFTGVAVSIEGQEVVLKSQMTAGWYRYTSEWRFDVDGTLRPRWGFGGVLLGDNCICHVHHHHVYWRLDFDIVSAGNNLVREFNNPPIFPGTKYHDKVYEVKREKDPGCHRHWEISNTRWRGKYALIPGPNDGVADEFGVGDMWVLKYHPGEIDDGVRFTSAIDAKANIDKFKNGEVVKDQDVVIWYAAHFKHNQSHEQGPEHGHIVGPEIRPLQW